jgi:hypothetical protein
MSRIPDVGDDHLDRFPVDLVEFASAHHIALPLRPVCAVPVALVLEPDGVARNPEVRLRDRVATGIQNRFVHDRIGKAGALDDQAEPGLVGGVDAFADEAEGCRDDRGIPPVGVCGERVAELGDGDEWAVAAIALAKATQQVVAGDHEVDQVELAGEFEPETRSAGEAQPSRVDPRCVLRATRMRVTHDAGALRRPGRACSTDMDSPVDLEPSRQRNPVEEGRR